MTDTQSIFLVLIAVVLIAVLSFGIGYMNGSRQETNQTPEDQYKLYRACLQNQDCIKTMSTEDWLKYYRLEWELEDE